jgi:hypothetical protein
VDSGEVAGFDAFPVAVAETADAAKDDAVVESEEFEANETRQRKARTIVIIEDAIARPGVVPSSCDHCQDGVAGSVEGLVAQYQGRPPFFSGLF